MTTIRERITDHGIRMSVNLGVPEGEPQDSERDDNWKRQATGWTCKLRYPADPPRTLVVPFWMGSGLGGRRPTAADVLDSLLSDAAGSAEPFASWCAEYGYDTDSRRAYRTWEACRKTRVDLVAFLGSEQLFEQFAYDTEKL